MENLYWALEYIKVFLAYLAVMYVWPSIMFYEYLKEKTRSIRFCFCVTTQVVLLNTVVLGLGLIHCLHGWLFALLFYGSLLIKFAYWLKKNNRPLLILERLLTGRYGIRLFFRNIRLRLRIVKKEKFLVSLQKGIKHKLEVILLAVVILFGMIYFTYGAFQDYSYGFGDMYTHHSWIYGLLEGKPYYKGIYPEAMHCFVYSICVCFGINIYSIQLFLAGIHVSAFFICAYLLLRELYTWKGTAILALTLFLTVDLLSVDQIFSMSRLQWTLPQEFGLYTQFLCALFLLRCLKSDFTDMPKGIKAKAKYFLANENLFLFTMALAASLAIHFYTTIMALFLCLVISGGYFCSFFQKKRLFSITAAVILGVFIAVAPMGLALAEGLEFQGSIGWAVNVINGTDTNEGRTDLAQQEMQNQNTQQETDNTEREEIENSEAPSLEPENVQKNIWVQIKDGAMQFWSYLQKKVTDLYHYGYLSLYQEERASWIGIFTIFSFAFWLVYRLVAGGIVHFTKGKVSKRAAHFFDGYPILAGMSVFFMLMYAAPYLGIPEFVAGARLCSTEQLLILSVIVIPMDICFGIIARTRFRLIVPFLLFFSVGGTYLGTQYLGIYHGYLYNELTRYNSAVNVTVDIMKQYPKNSYTIVSTTDELYQVNEHGRHEELLTFLQKIENDKYVLPTEYIFLYVEKNPLQYAQSHFQTGPSWLAEEKYTQYYKDAFSEGDDILASVISEESGKQDMIQFSKQSESYSNLGSRTILESKAYEWYLGFSRFYPLECSVYYEDDDFVCYRIRQNSNRLFPLEV